MSVIVRYSDELYHHGIKGQKWGIRRYQNPDGSYTPEGLKRYGRSTHRTAHDFSNHELNIISNARNLTDPKARYKKTLAAAGIKEEAVKDLFDKRIAQQNSVLKETTDDVKKLKSNKREFDRCKLVSSLSECLAYGGEEITGDELIETLRYTLDNDGFSDESDINPYAYHAYKRGMTSKYDSRLADLYGYDTSFAKLESEIDDRLSSLGVNGGNKVMVPSSKGDKKSLGNLLAHDIVRITNDKMENDPPKHKIELLANAYAWGSDGSMHKFYEGGERLASKLGLKNSNMVGKLSDAIEDLGLSDTPMNQWRSSDWQDLREELNDDW